MSEEKANVREFTPQRKDLHILSEAFHQASTASRADSEDRTTYQKFKYYAARNKDRMDAKLKETVKELERIQLQVDKDRRDDAEFMTFMEEQTNVLEFFASKGEDGNAITNERDEYQLEGEMRKKADVALKELGAKYADAVQRDVDRKTDGDKAIRDYLDTYITIRVFTMPWETVPERIGGGFLVKIAPMLVGVPDDEDDAHLFPFDPDKACEFFAPEGLSVEDQFAFINAKIEQHVPISFRDQFIIEVDPLNTSLVTGRYIPERD